MVGQTGQGRKKAQVWTLHVPSTSLMVLGCSRMREHQDASSANMKIKNHISKQLNKTHLTINGPVLQV